MVTAKFFLTQPMASLKAGLDIKLEAILGQHFFQHARL